ncbi:MAG: helix-turn-helix domain-containing protein [Candidatus Aenigmatarchaeota archaeon]
MEISSEELVNLLKNFGMNDYEAKVYSALVFLGPSKASEISRESKVPQSKIYEVLERLAERQLVEVYSIRPKEFKAVSPEVSLRNLIEENERKIREAKEKVEKISFILKPRIESQVLNGIWTSQGKGWKDFIDRLCDMFDRAKSYAYVVSRDFSWTSNLAEAVDSCIRRGVKIRTIAIGGINESNYRRAKWFNDHGVEIRVFKTNLHPRMIDIDGREILLRLDTEMKKESFRFTSVWSSDASLVKVFDVYLKSLWKNAEPFKF